MTASKTGRSHAGEARIGRRTRRSRTRIRTASRPFGVSTILIDTRGPSASGPGPAACNTARRTTTSLPPSSPATTPKPSSGLNPFTTPSSGIGEAMSTVRRGGRGPRSKPPPAPPKPPPGRRRRRRDAGRSGAGGTSRVPPEASDGQALRRRAGPLHPCDSCPSRVSGATASDKPGFGPCGSRLAGRYGQGSTLKERRRSIWRTLGGHGEMAGNLMTMSAVLAVFNPLMS